MRMDVSKDVQSKTTKKTDSAPKGLRFVVRVWAMVAALCMISTGLFVLLTITAKCFVAGIFQISVGVLIIPLEAPIFCTSFEKLIKLSDWVEHTFKYWMRAGLYLGFAIFPVCMCLELSTFLGCGALGVLAALYGLLTIGKKGSDADVKKTKDFSSTNKTDDIEMRASLMTPSGDPNELNTY